MTFLRFRRPLSQLVCLATLALLTAAAFDNSDLRGQPNAAQPAPATDPLNIVVESVSGTVYYTRAGRRERVTTNSELAQGDRIHANPGAVCKLEFQRPTSRETLSATIIRGYTDLVITQALQQGQSTRTLLDMRQGVIRAGVVRTAVPPSFRVRTPRSVVAVRGTEIAQLEASNDRGDTLTMGVVGAAMVNDVVPLYRSARAGQGVRKRINTDRRSSKLLRAIEVAVLGRSRTIAGPHRRGFEVDLVRRNITSIPIEFNTGEFHKREGNLNRDRLNSGRGRFELLNEINFLQNFDPWFQNPMQPMPPNPPPMGGPSP